MLATRPPIQWKCWIKKKIQTGGTYLFFVGTIITIYLYISRVFYIMYLDSIHFPSLWICPLPLYLAQIKHNSRGKNREKINEKNKKGKKFKILPCKLLQWVPTSQAVYIPLIHILSPTIWEAESGRTLWVQNLLVYIVSFQTCQNYKVTLSLPPPSKM